MFTMQTPVFRRSIIQDFLLDTFQKAHGMWAVTHLQWIVASFHHLASVQLIPWGYWTNMVIYI